MALTLSTSAKNAALDGIDALINTGSGTAVIEYRTASDVEVCTMNLNNPAFNAASGGTMALDTSTAEVVDTSATGNVTNVSKFVIKDRDGNIVITGTLASDGTGDINLNTTLIPTGARVELDSFSLTA
jgi:hypothetical protein